MALDVIVIATRETVLAALTAAETALPTELATDLATVATALAVEVKKLLTADTADENHPQLPLRSLTTIGLFMA